MESLFSTKFDFMPQFQLRTFMKNLLVILFATLSISMSINSYAQDINPGDGIRIFFLDIAEAISGDYYIQPNGLIALPLIGVINTNNKDFKEIKSEIEFRYNSLYKDPHLSINALFRINILGDVGAPGFYYVPDYEKFTAILAFAGGTTASADLANIKLIRNFELIEIDVETIIQEGGTASDFGLQSGDQVFVPRTWWADNGVWVGFAFAVFGLLLTIYLVFIVSE